MNLTEAIRQRTSCRTFNGLRLDKVTTAEIRRLITGLEPLWPEVGQPLIVLIDKDDAPARLGTYGFINGARQFLVMAVGDTTEEKVQGAFMLEHLIVQLTAMGLATCWLGGTFRRGPFEAAMIEKLRADGVITPDVPVDVPVDAPANAPVDALPGGRSVQIVVPVGHPTPRRRLADRIMRGMVKADHRLPFARLFPGIDPESKLGEVMQSVRLAPSSANSQPWRATLVSIGCDRDAATPQGGMQSVAFTCAKSSAYAPFDMGIAYSHFVMAAADAGLGIVPGPVREAMSLSFCLKESHS